MKICVIVPAFNEELNIENTISKLNKYNNLHKDKIDYIIVNDGSTDNTSNICIKNNYNCINLICNLGIGGAMQTGYKYAYDNNYDIAIQFDGDGQHDENYIDKLIKELKNGYDMVIGSRYISNISEFKSTRMRQFGGKIISYFIKLMTNTKISDPTSGFRAVNKNIIKIFSINYPLEYPEPVTLTYLIKNGYKVKEIPVKMHKRLYGRSSIKPFKSAYYMINVILSILLIDVIKRD